MKTNTQHTPGPWQVKVENSLTPGFLPCVKVIANGHNGSGLVATCHGTDVREANSRLIAAAPELLGALEAMLHGYGGELPKLDAIARTAINKAKGE